VFPKKSSNPLILKITAKTVPSCDSFFHHIGANQHLEQRFLHIALIYLCPMKFLYPLFTLLLLCLILQQGSAQPAYLLNIGTVDSLYSNILHESREIYVQLPANYDPDRGQKYPVVIVLDGEVLMDAVTTVYNYYYGGFLPEMVLVGISNSENRTRDLTTSKIERRHGAAFTEAHGEAEKFTQFIAQELLPYLENKYPVTDYRTLIGHSYGGLFAINALVHHTELFDNYLAIDPSLDWDDQRLLKEVKASLQPDRFAEKSLFLTLSGQLHLRDYSITIDNVMEDTSEFTLFSRSNIEFAQLGQDHDASGLDLQWKFYPNDLHGTVPLPSILDGLIALFDWFQMENTDKFNQPDTPTEDLLAVIRYREAKLKKHFGYAVPPYAEDLLNMLGYMYMDMDQPQKSRTLFELNTEYYPHSPNVYDALADYYESQKDHRNALLQVTKAFEISGDAYYQARMVELRGKVE
jgi:predicted alpha/beta superfamily hydrolase